MSISNHVWSRFYLASTTKTESVPLRWGTETLGKSCILTTSKNAKLNKWHKRMHWNQIELFLFFLPVLKTIHPTVRSSLKICTPPLSDPHLKLVIPHWLSAALLKHALTLRSTPTPGLHLYISSIWCLAIRVLFIGVYLLHQCT